MPISAVTFGVDRPAALRTVRSIPMRTLFDEPPQRRRSPLALALSVVVHLGAAAAIAFLAFQTVVTPRLEVQGRMLSVILAGPTRIAEPVKRIELPATMTAARTPDLVVSLPPPPPVEEVAPPLAEPRPPIAPPKAEAVAPKPDIRVGLFADAAAAAVNPQPARQVNTAGFDTAAVAPDLKLRPAVTGAFAATSLPAQPGNDRARGTIGATGFDSAAVAGPSSTGRVVKNTGFGSPGEQSDGASRTAAVVRTGGFEEAQTPPMATSTQTRVTPRTTPVEVLFKPTPAYTDEARALGIQGEVVLEVEFAASGSVRVLRVVRGLGHGLDEMATRAATQIRFKPAASDGQSVDFRATVQILFRLT